MSRGASGAALATFAALLALGGAARAQPPASPETTLYRVRAGDSCVEIARRFYGDPAAYTEIHEHNPGLGPPPHRLRPGALLRLPPRGSSAPAQLSALRRRVEHRAPTARAFAEAHRGEVLRRGSQIRTLEEASAEITFRDRTRVQMRERTLVIVYGGARRYDQRALSRAELERGTLRSHLEELAGLRPIEVQTPGSRATLPGAAVVSVDGEGTSRVANHGRRAASVITEGGGRIELPGGTGTVVRRGGRPSRPRRLLAAPRWVVDPGGPVLGFAGLGATVRGSWEVVQGAARYRVEISHEPDGGELVSVLDLPGDAPRFAARGLGAGTYYVRVATVDGEGLEGRRSPRRVFTVREARLLPPGGLSLQTPEEADQPPRVPPGSWLVAPRGFSCGEGEARSAIYTLREAGRRSLTCTRDGGIHILRAEVEVEALVARRIEGDALLRERRVALRLLLEGGRAPPAHALRVEGPESLRVEPPRLLGERTLVVPITPHIEAPDAATLSLWILAGAERIPLGTLEIAIADPPPPEPPAEVPSAPPPEAAAPPLSELWAGLPLPSSLGLIRARTRGVAGWAQLSLLEAAPSQEPQIRLGVGVRARIPRTPLGLGFGTQLDLLQPPIPRERRGDADLLASADLALFEGEELDLGLDLSAWIPTRSDAGLGRARLAPSLKLALRPAPWIALRTRQGALVDAVPGGAALYAFAAGADLFPLEGLGLGVELDGSMGRFADGGEGISLALGASVTARWSWLSASIGARAALTDEARALLGAWSASLRIEARSE